MSVTPAGDSPGAVTQAPEEVSVLLDADGPGRRTPLGPGADA